MPIDFIDLMELTYSELTDRLRNIPIENLDPENKMVVEDALYCLSGEPERRLNYLGFNLELPLEDRLAQAKQIYANFTPYQESVGYGKLTKRDLFRAFEFFSSVAGYDDTSLVDAVRSELNGEIDSLNVRKRYFRYLIGRRIEENRDKSIATKVIQESGRIHWTAAYARYLNPKEKYIRKLYSLERKDALPIVIIAAEQAGVFLEVSPLEEAKRMDISVDSLLKCFIASYVEPQQLISYMPDLSSEEDNWEKNLSEEIERWRNIFREKILAAWSEFPLVEPTAKDIIDALPEYRFGILRELSNSSLSSINKLLDKLVKRGVVFRIEDSFGQGMYFY